MVPKFISSLASAVLALAVLVQEPAPVSIKVSATTFFANTDIIVTCTVPRHEDNRKLTALITMEEGMIYSSSQHDLDGTSTITHRFVFKTIPCGTIAAACILTDKYQRSYSPAIQRLEVAGCDAQ